MPSVWEKFRDDTAEAMTMHPDLNFDNLLADRFGDKLKRNYQYFKQNLALQHGTLGQAKLKAKHLLDLFKVGQPVEVAGSPEELILKLSEILLEMDDTADINIVVKKHLVQFQRPGQLTLDIFEASFLKDGKGDLLPNRYGESVLLYNVNNYKKIEYHHDILGANKSSKIIKASVLKNHYPNAEALFCGVLNQQNKRTIDDIEILEKVDGFFVLPRREDGKDGQVQDFFICEDVKKIQDGVLCIHDYPIGSLVTEKRQSNYSGRGFTFGVPKVDVTTSPASGNRFALLITNSYPHGPDEKSNMIEACITDGDEMKKALDSNWCDSNNVTRHSNLDLEEMKSHVKTFSDKLKEGDEVLFYFSGHGLTIDGEQFFTPCKKKVGISPNTPATDVINDRYCVLHAQNLFIKKVKKSFKIIIMDCCRTRFFDRIMTKDDEDNKNEYQDVMNETMALMKTEGSYNLVRMYATNDTNASSCTQMSDFTKALAPMIAKKLHLHTIQNELDEKAQKENWVQKPTMHATKLDYKF